MQVNTIKLFLNSSKRDLKTNNEKIDNIHRHRSKIYNDTTKNRRVKTPHISLTFLNSNSDMLLEYRLRK